MARDKKVMNPLSLANLPQNKKQAPRGKGNAFAKAFKEDLLALWTRKVHGEPGTTKGMKLLERAAESSPMAFVAMASKLLPKDLQPVELKMDFSQVLMQLNRKMGSAQQIPQQTEEEEYDDIIDEDPVIEIFETTGSLPMDLEDDK